ncbi:MAG: FecR domain-containing protein [Candidatus Pseudomonas phytovorans]|uniref:FecR domain-containing protein n=1 Tax=Candidatus Pseudomonas phytovorans TaxID=3121377 RepID=A0AAJ6BBK6_9PSED|nr:FecR domain-containing protein [Pseudomonas sp.]WEK28671.1 MAG: FecR domain-containing protein [Pseudomonas sp.]
MSPRPQHQALSAAAQWFARLGEAPTDPALQQRWQAWHAEDPQHQWAWQQVALLQARLNQAQGALGYGVLERADQHGPVLQRRMLLKGLLLGAGLGALSWRGYRDAPVWLADVRTAIGEQRRLTLSDGSRLILNTASAVDIAFSNDTRQLHLRAGEIFVETAADHRPFMVNTAEGCIRALGTRFSIRQQEHQTRVCVYQHAVVVTPTNAVGEPTHLGSGRSLLFDNTRILQYMPLANTDAAWTEGRLVVDDWRLDHLLEELQRYRSGYLGCAEAVGHLRVSGAYSLTDLDLTLSTVARSLPVRLVRHTRFWTRVEPLTSSA